ncbi:hypothetical protein OG625_40310 (plasmid) [Streptomyces sp. NBC_01351]|uniref:hypothetical protein n=1 Tax=Streptomyces sp. NBC_01351 TaxID=2903833 RepID=UPI002E2FCE74|nr:hypothetical protein [Streptomyces sp. NBC_01351]
MSHTTHRPRHTRPTRRTSRYLLAFASAAFISGAIAIPASAATAPTAPSAVASVLTDIPGTNDDTTEYGGNTGQKDSGSVYDDEYGDFIGGGIIGGNGGNGGSGGNDDTTEYGGNAGGNPHRDPAGGAYGPDTCKQGYVWRESFDGDTQCVTPAERDVAKAGAN